MNIRYQDKNTAIKPKSAERIKPKWWNSMLCHIFASSTKQWLDSCYTKFMSRSLTLLILQSGVTLIPHHLGLEILLYRAQAPDSLCRSFPPNALFYGCPMRDHAVSLVGVGLECASSIQWVGSTSAPQADDDQDRNGYREAVFEGGSIVGRLSVLAQGVSTVLFFLVNWEQCGASATSSIAWL